MANLFSDYKFHSYSASWLGLTLDYSKSRSGTTQNYSFTGDISVHPPSGGSTSFGYTITVTIYCDNKYSTGQILKWNPGTGIKSVKRQKFSGSVGVPNKTSGTTSFYVAIHLSNGFDYSPGGTLPIDDYAYWNDINAYQPDGSTQNGLIFDLTTSDGGSWTNLTNEPTPSSLFTKPPGTTATISNIRSNITGAHYTTNNVTNDGSTSFSWTFNTANWVCKLYSAWDTYAITYNANGGTQSTCPATHYKTYNVTANIATQIPSRPDVEVNGYTITFNPGEGTAEYTTYTSVNSTLYTFQKWNTKADGSGTNYYGTNEYTTNAALALYAQWSSTYVKGGVYFPNATRANYDLVGWTRDPNNVSLVEEGYIPTKNETLYAVWSPVHTYINTRTNDGWKTPVVYVKKDNVWTVILDVRVKYNGQWVSPFLRHFNVENMACSMTAGMTWGQFLDSGFNTYGWYIDELSNGFFIIIEEDVGEPFVISGVSASTLNALKNTPITENYTYSIKKHTT